MEQKAVNSVVGTLKLLRFLCENNNNTGIIIDDDLKKEVELMTDSEILAFAHMFETCFIGNHTIYTFNVVKNQLLDLGYSVKLVNYLMGIPEKVQIAEVKDDITIELQENILIDEKENLEEANKNLLNFEWRDNQIIAINQTIAQNFKSGIHHQFMGAGKSNIMLKLIAEHFRIKQVNGAYLLLCDRQEILKKMFFDENHNLDESKIIKWKQDDVIDLTLFSIKDCVYDKSIDIVSAINKKDKPKPLFIICNNAFMRSREYKEIKRNKLLLTIVDECHSVSGKKSYKLLSHMKYILTCPIIGFSATPLRKGAEKNLVDIFSKSTDPLKQNKKLNIISQYGFFECIRDDIVLPPCYHYVEIHPKDNKEKNKIGVANFDITKNIFTEVLEQLPYKKIIGWCKNIAQLKEWYNFFSTNFPQLTIYMSSFKDKDLTAEGYNCNFDNYCLEKKDAILLCVNRCREGFDDSRVDCVIYLNAVKNRSLLVAMQTGARANRIDYDRLKKHGVVIDMFVASPHNRIEHMTVDKIMEYYNMILNLTDTIDDIHSDKNKLYATYMMYKKLAKNTIINENKNEITIKLDRNHTIEIKIELIKKTIDWSFLSSLRNDAIKEALNINETEELRLNFKYMKKKYDIENLNPKNWKRTYKKMFEEHPKLISPNDIYSKNKKYWNNTNWFKALNIDKFYYGSLTELIEVLYKHPIKTFDDYIMVATDDNKMPLDIMEYYGIEFNVLLMELKKYKKSKEAKKSNNNSDFL